MTKHKTYLVHGIVAQIVVATSPEEAKKIARDRYDMDVRGTPEEVTIDETARLVNKIAIGAGLGTRQGDAGYPGSRARRAKAKTKR